MLSNYGEVIICGSDRKSHTTVYRTAKPPNQLVLPNSSHSPGPFHLLCYDEFQSHSLADSHHQSLPSFCHKEILNLARGTTLGPKQLNWAYYPTKKLPTKHNNQLLLPPYADTSLSINVFFPWVGRPGCWSSNFCRCLFSTRVSRRAGSAQSLPD